MITLLFQHPKIETPVRRNSKSADKAGKKVIMVNQYIQAIGSVSLQRNDFH